MPERHNSRGFRVLFLPCTQSLRRNRSASYCREATGLPLLQRKSNLPEHSLLFRPVPMQWSSQDHFLKIPVFLLYSLKGNIRFRMCFLPLLHGNRSVQKVPPAGHLPHLRSVSHPLRRTDRCNHKSGWTAPVSEACSQEYPVPVKSPYPSTDH